MYNRVKILWDWWIKSRSAIVELSLAKVQRQNKQKHKIPGLPPRHPVWAIIKKLGIIIIWLLSIFNDTCIVEAKKLRFKKKALYFNSCIVYHLQQTASLKTKANLFWKYFHHFRIWSLISSFYLNGTFVLSPIQWHCYQHFSSRHWPKVLQVSCPSLGDHTLYFYEG